MDQISPMREGGYIDRCVDITRNMIGLDRKELMQQISNHNIDGFLMDDGVVDACLPTDGLISQMTDPESMFRYPLVNGWTTDDTFGSSNSASGSALHPYDADVSSPNKDININDDSPGNNQGNGYQFDSGTSGTSNGLVNGMILACLGSCDGVASSPSLNYNQWVTDRTQALGALNYDQVADLVHKNNFADGKNGFGAAIPDEVIIAQAWKESGFVPTARAKCLPGKKCSTATGLLQVTEGNALKQLSQLYDVNWDRSDMLDPAKNIQAATLYLDWAARVNGGLMEGLNAYGTGDPYADDILKAAALLQQHPAQPIAVLNKIIRRW